MFIPLRKYSAWVRIPGAHKRGKTRPRSGKASTPDWPAERFSFVSLYRKEEVSYIVASPITGFEIPERHSGYGSPVLMDAAIVLPQHLPIHVG
jgi:hypothetical protein